MPKGIPKSGKRKQVSYDSTCGCGCGLPTKAGARFRNGHKSAWEEAWRVKAPDCPCGCGKRVPPGKKFATSGCACRGRNLDLSKDERAVRAERMSNQRKDPDFNQKYIDATKLKPYVSERNKRNWKDPRYRAKQTARIRAMQPRFEEARRKQKIEFWRDPGRRKEQSERSKRLWKTDEFRAKFFRILKDKYAIQLRPSRPHLVLKGALEKAGLTFETNHQIGPFCVDEADPVTMVVVEVDGCFWHGCPEHGKPPFRPTQKRSQAKDKRENEYLEVRGWRLIRVWEHDIRGDLAGCVKRIKEAILEKSIDLRNQ